MRAKRNTLQLGIGIAVILAIGGFALLGRGGSTSSADAHELVAAGARLVDVRTASEFAAGHIPGAVNIPVQELDRRIGEFGAKDQSIVVYCHSGSRSARAVRQLESAGYVNVHDLGAMRRW